MKFNTLDTLDVSGKTVLLRADLNVPYIDGQVTDTTRIDRIKPTIDMLVSKGAKIVLMSHFGRPKGERKDEYSLQQIVATISKQLGRPVGFAKDCIGEDAKNAAAALNAGDIVLLENLRFHAGEESNDAEFVDQLAALGDVFLNDAFSTAHRAHASTVGLAEKLSCAAGLLMQAELEALASVLDTPQKPVAAVVGGAKISSKLAVLHHLVKNTDYLILGGGMANTFLFAQGAEIGQSLCEKDMADEARSIMKTAEDCGCKMILPKDRIIVKEFGENAPHEVCGIDRMPTDQEGVDIGPATIASIGSVLDNCKTVLWNGPMGVFEVRPFDNGTNEVARKVAALTSAGKLKSVAGGGDTVSALANAGVLDDFSYVSTAGGAFLEWMEGKVLPGVAALEENCNRCENAA